ncbi:hypothetical protein JOB18_044162 [Solea senegalensis]|uniref:Uncharacterized protein n=1 Tax=Solea senegalensis TaxID=28829 RepID=A0AAV6RVB0_SOLSE|nr:hypothetical protein JOB18_044162 [Solea senegalensis]
MLLPSSPFCASNHSTLEEAVESQNYEANLHHQTSPFELRSTRTDCFLSCDHWTEHRSTSDVLQET